MAIADLNKTSTNRPIDTMYSGEALNDTASPDTEPGIYAELPPLISKALQPSVQPGESSRQLSRLEAERSNWSSDLFRSMNLPGLSSTFHHIIQRAALIPSIVYLKLDLPWLQRRHIPGIEPEQSIGTFVYHTPPEPLGPKPNAEDYYTSLPAPDEYTENDYPFQSTDNINNTITEKRTSPISTKSNQGRSIPSSPQLNPKSVIPAVNQSVSTTSRTSGAAKESSNTHIKTEQLSLLTRRLSRKAEPPTKTQPLNKAQTPPGGVPTERHRTEQPTITGTADNPERPATTEYSILPTQETLEETNIDNNGDIDSTPITQQHTATEIPTNTVSGHKTAVTVNGITPENVQPRIPATPAIQKKSTLIVTPPKQLSSIDMPADTVNEKLSPATQRNTTAGSDKTTPARINQVSIPKIPGVSDKRVVERQASQKAPIAEIPAGNLPLTSTTRKAKTDSEAPVAFKDASGQSVQEKSIDTQASRQAAEVGDVPDRKDSSYQIDWARKVENDRQSDGIKADVPPVFKSISEKTGQAKATERKSSVESPYSKPPVQRVNISPEEVTTRQQTDSGYAYETGQSKRIQPRTYSDTVKIDTPQIVKNVLKKAEQDIAANRTDVQDRPPVQPASVPINESAREINRIEESDSSSTPDTRKTIASEPRIQPDVIKADTPTIVKNVLKKTGQVTTADIPNIHERHLARPASTQISEPPKDEEKGSGVEAVPVMGTEKSTYSSPGSGQIRTTAARDIPAKQSIQTPDTNTDIGPLSQRSISRRSTPDESTNYKPVYRVPDESEGSYLHEYAGDAISDIEVTDTSFDKYAYVNSELSSDHKDNSQISNKEHSVENQAPLTLPFIERITDRAGQVTPHILRSAVKLPFTETGEIEPVDDGYTIPPALQQRNRQQTMNLPVAAPIRTQSHIENARSDEISRSISDVYREPARPAASIAGDLTLVPVARVAEATSPEPTGGLQRVAEEASEEEPMPDIRMIADRVYALLKHDLKIERERERHRLLR